MPCSAAPFQVFFTVRAVVTPGSSNFRSPEKYRLCLTSLLLILLDVGSFPAFSTFFLHSRYKAFSGECFHLKAAFKQCIGWCYPRQKRGRPKKYPSTIGPKGLYFCVPGLPLDDPVYREDAFKIIMRFQTVQLRV